MGPFRRAQRQALASASVPQARHGTPALAPKCEGATLSDTSPHHCSSWLSIDKDKCYVYIYIYIYIKLSLDTYGSIEKISETNRGILACNQFVPYFRKYRSQTCSYWLGGPEAKSSTRSPPHVASHVALLGSGRHTLCRCPGFCMHHLAPNVDP